MDVVVVWVWYGRYHLPYTTIKVQDVCGAWRCPSVSVPSVSTPVLSSREFNGSPLGKQRQQQPTTTQTTHTDSTDSDSDSDSDLTCCFRL